MFGFKDEASYICLNLSTYVKSGMPIGRSLDLIKNTVKDKKYKESLKRIEKKVLNGEALSKAFKEEGNLYPDLMKDMMKIGEESGNLEEVLEKCARNILAEKEIKNKIIKKKKAMNSNQISSSSLFIHVSLQVLIFLKRLSWTL